MYLGHIVLYGLEALLHVRPVFHQQINCRLKSTPLKVSWNDFPKLVINSIINKTLNAPSITGDSHDVNETNNEVTIYFRVHYYGDKGWLNPTFAKPNQIAKNNDQLPSEFYMTSQKKIFCSAKDKTPTLNQSFVVYEFVCPGCSANYIGKTERTLFKRNLDHAWSDKDSVKLASILMNAMVFSICSILPN